MDVCFSLFLYFPAIQWGLAAWSSFVLISSSVLLCIDPFLGPVVIFSGWHIPFPFACSRWIAELSAVYCRKENRGSTKNDSHSRKLQLCTKFAISSFHCLRFPRTGEVLIKTWTIGSRSDKKSFAVSTWSGVWRARSFGNTRHVKYRNSFWTNLNETVRLAFRTRVPIIGNTHVSLRDTGTPKKCRTL